MTNSKNIDIFYDAIDEATMLVFEETNLNYLESLIRVSDGLVSDLNIDRLSLETIKKIEDIYNRVMKIMFLNEEIRIAFSLLAIKGLKETSYRLDIVTPDSINYIITNIINHYSIDGDVILDLTMGIGNLLASIHNFSETNIKLIGIEQESILAELSRVNTNIQEIETTIYCNDPIDINNIKPNIIVGDLDFPDQKEFKLITKQIENLEEDGIFIYLIKNDFFSNPKIKEFKENFKGEFSGLIILPDTMFKDKDKKKSILIGTKKITNEQMMLINMPTLTDREKVVETMNILNEWITKLKGSIR